LKTKEKYELYKIIRDQIVHEDNLVNQRLNWILFSQSFLFAAFFTIWSVGFNQKNEGILILNFFLPFIGTAFSFFGIMSIIGAFKALSNLRQFWFFKNKDEGDWTKDNHTDNPEEEIYNTKELPDIFYKGKKSPRIVIGKIKSFSASNAAINIPIAIMIGWLILLVANVIFYKSGFPITKDIELRIKAPKENQFIVFQESDSIKIQQIIKEQGVLKRNLDSLLKLKK
jgi:hypothetical protein